MSFKETLRERHAFAIYGALFISRSEACSTCSQHTDLG